MPTTAPEYPDFFDAEVTPELIEKAGETIENCPIALSIMPHFKKGSKIEVFSDFFKVNGIVYEAHPCQSYDMAVFTERYDNDKEVEPIEIEFQRM